MKTGGAGAPKTTPPRRGTTPAGAAVVGTNEELGFHPRRRHSCLHHHPSHTRVMRRCRRRRQPCPQPPPTSSACNTYRGTTTALHTPPPPPSTTPDQPGPPAQLPRCTPQARSVARAPRPPGGSDPAAPTPPSSSPSPRRLPHPPMPAAPRCTTTADQGRRPMPQAAADWIWAGESQIRGHLKPPLPAAAKNLLLLLSTQIQIPNPPTMARGGLPEKNGGGCGRCCLGFLLKFLAFLQAFAALSAVLYAASILSRWARHHELHIHHLLPDLWFACAVMAAGLLYCAILLAGYVAAEISSGCCLCFYTGLAMVMMLLEAAVAGRILLNEHWIQDLPYDRTRELENLVSFVNDNLDLCKWAALATVATQALSLLLAMVLQAMVSPTSSDCDSDEDFVVIRRPLLIAQGAPSYLPTMADPRGVHPNLWSSSMRQKYGLNSSGDYTYNTLDQNAVPPQ